MPEKPYGPTAIRRPPSPFGLGYLRPNIVPEQEGYFAEETRKHHPRDLDEGLVEKAVKYLGAKSHSLMSYDVPFLEQYLHPDREVLERTKLRPTKATPVPHVYRKPPEPGTEQPGLGGYTRSKGPDYESVYDVWDFERPPENKGLSIDNQGWKGKLVNASEPAINWFMKQIGTPYAVYDRYPLSPPPRELGWKPNPQLGKNKK